jgi:hypothetical protein
MPLNPLQKANYAMMRLMVRVMPSCRDISQLISAGMDCNLPLRKRLSIRLHVSMCKFCRRYEKQLHLLHEGVGHYADPDENEVEKSLSPEAKAKLEKALENSAK